MTKVIVHICCGAIQHIISDEPVDVILLDSDESYRDDSIEIELYPSEGKESFLPVGIYSETNPTKVNKIMKSL